VLEVNSLLFAWNSLNCPRRNLPKHWPNSNLWKMNGGAAQMTGLRAEDGAIRWQGEVIDVFHCPTTMALQAFSMSPALLMTFQSLPYQMQNVIAMTALFRFCKRKRTSEDDSRGIYSPTARFYTNLLQEKGLLQHVAPADIIAFKCLYCHNSGGPHIPGSVSFITLDNLSPGAFTTAMQHRSSHLCSCPHANHSQNMAAFVMIPPAYSYLTIPTTELFGQQWIQHIRKVRFDQMPSSGGQIRIQKDVSFIVRLADQFWERSIQGLHQNYNEELDYLHHSIFCPGLVSEIIEEQDLVPLPLPSSTFKGNAWVSLQSHHIAPCQNDSAFFRADNLDDNRLTGSTQGWKPIQRSVRSSSFRLHGRIDANDVVMPTRGCTGEVLREIYNLKGNRRFLRLVSKHRGKYKSVSKDADRASMAREIVNKIEKGRGGVFRTVFCREVDGEAVVSKSKFECDVIAYCRLRLEHGFPDVFTMCGRKDEPFQMYTSASSGTYINKVMHSERTPSVEILSGTMSWDLGQPEIDISINDIYRNNLNSTPLSMLKNLTNPPIRYTASRHNPQQILVA
jgi:hypothetical protein